MVVLLWHLLSRLKILRQCFQAWYSYSGSSNGPGLGASKSGTSRLNDGLSKARLWLSIYRSCLPYIIAGGRGSRDREGQCQLAKSTDLVSMTGLPTVTFISLVVFCFLTKKRNIIICISPIFLDFFKKEPQF